MSSENSQIIPRVKPSSESVGTVVIEAQEGWRIIDWREIIEYRDLFFYLTWRGIKVRYAQSVIGFGWAIIQPLVSMLVFSIVFGKLAKVSSDGVPYAIFSYAGLVPWTYFSNALTESANSLVANSAMISKVYFPRLVLPLSAVLSKLVDFLVAMTILGVLMIYFGMKPNSGILLVPALVVLMMLTAAGAGMWLTALAIQYRDVKYALTFVVQLLMYAAPVVYPASIVPEQYQLLYAVNPMVGVIEGFRAAFLSTRAMPLDLLAVGTVSAVLLALSGAMYFRRKEKLFADVA